jgi:hypothetical protein
MPPQPATGLAAARSITGDQELFHFKLRKIAQQIREMNSGYHTFDPAGATDPSNNNA